ncbi:prolactin receptor [Oryzias melastigma]|uniref:Prolactin receptor n=1 Tax=Oryzias melastigma TaxID=30732 RepID=A0A834CW99_ORYME|nr:prolactin receptor [Oryzias melastigma]
MMKNDGGVILFWLLLLFTLYARGKSYSVPGKPTLTRCRSPEKETFTCWWEPSSDGGLPTTYKLYYRKEDSSDVEYECQDYRTGGKNSCFFNKNYTSIWVNYNITIVAINALGQTFSDPVDIDVYYIVEPNPPENLNVTIQNDKSWPFLRASWDPPKKADTRSGWITLIYELRIKLEEEDEWEIRDVGQQKVFNIYGLQSEGTYVVQIRCRPDHGFWSEWSADVQVKVPNYLRRNRSTWIMIIVFSAVVFLILSWLLHINSRNLKHCILPPVPGPKIKGFDKKLHKSGKSLDAFKSLDVPDFPHHTFSKSEDLLVEFIEVYVPEEQELMPEKSNGLHDGCLKSESSVSDCDSGRGSCDSHTLLLDKSGQQTDTQDSQIDEQRLGEDLQDEKLSYAHQDMVSPDMSAGKVKTWPSVFSPLPQNRSTSADQASSLEMAKQHCLSDSLLPSEFLSSYHSLSGHGTPEHLGSNYWEFNFGNKRPNLTQLQTQARHQAHSEINIFTTGVKAEPAALKFPTPRSSDYVEVQRVNEEDSIVLRPVGSNYDKHFEIQQGEEYSRVKGVDSDNVLLLLQKEAMEEEMDMCPCEQLSGTTEAHYTKFSTSPEKPTACTHPTPQPLEERVVNGYVDTATMFTMPPY